MPVGVKIVVMFARGLLDLSWLEAVRPVSDPVEPDRCKKIFSESLATSRVEFAFQGEYRLEGLNRLDRGFETDCPWFNQELRGRLSHHCPNEIVCQHMRPDFLPNQIGRLATQLIHLHRLFQRSDIQFDIPAFSVERREFFFRILNRIKERRRKDKNLVAEPGSGDPYSADSYPQAVR